MKHIREEMELFIPSLIILLLGAIICFFVLPKMSPYTLGALAIVMFGLGVWQHYHMFPYEYSASMVSDLLRQYSGFIMLLAVIVATIISILLMFGVTPPDASDILPEIALPNMMGNSGNAKNANTNAAKNVGMFGAVTNNSNKNTGIMGAITNILPNASKNEQANGKNKNVGLMGAVTNAVNNAVKNIVPGTNASTNASTNAGTNAGTNGAKNNAKKNNLASASFKVV